MAQYTDSYIRPDAYRIQDRLYRMPIFEALQMASMDYPTIPHFIVETERHAYIGTYRRID